MTEDAKAARREYIRKWKQQNKDKVRAYNAAYWERKAKLAEEAQCEK